MSADESTHPDPDVEGEAAEAQEIEQREPIYDPVQSGPVTAALASRARDLSLAITNPATLARKLRESLIDLVGPEQSRAYHIGASYDSERGEVRVQIAAVSPTLLAQFQISGQQATLAAAYTSTVNGWEVAVGVQITYTGDLRGGNLYRVPDDYSLGASFSVTVRR